MQAAATVKPVRGALKLLTVAEAALGIDPMHTQVANARQNLWDAKEALRQRKERKEKTDSEKEAYTKKSRQAAETLDLLFGRLRSPEPGSTADTLMTKLTGIYDDQPESWEDDVQMREFRVKLINAANECVTLIVDEIDTYTIAIATTVTTSPTVPQQPAGHKVVRPDTHLQL